jgi:hypothetical protein
VEVPELLVPIQQLHRLPDLPFVPAWTDGCQIDAGGP